MPSLRSLLRRTSLDPAGLVLPLLGVVLGSAALVFLSSGLHGATYALERTSQRASGTNVVRVIPGKPLGTRADLARGLTPQDARALQHKEHLADAQVGTATTLHQREASVGRKTMPVGVQAGNAADLRLDDLQILHGRMLDPAETGRRHCVIGHDVWKRLFDGTWPPPDAAIVLDGSTRLAVVGVLRPKPPMGGGSGGETWRVDRKVYVSDATFERAVRGAPNETSITLAYDAAKETGKETSLRLAPYLQALHRGVGGHTWEPLEGGMALDEVIRSVLMAVLLLGGGLSIAVGGINVMNSQLVTVSERAREFALRRALGLSASRLRRGVLAESVGIAVLGAMMGVGLGALGAWGLSSLLTSLVAPWPFTVVPGSIVGAVGACGLAGLLAGWIPARRASEVAPAVVLRGE